MGVIRGTLLRGIVEVPQVVKGTLKPLFNGHPHSSVLLLIKGSLGRLRAFPMMGSLARIGPHYLHSLRLPLGPHHGDFCVPHLPKWSSDHWYNIQGQPAALEFIAHFPFHLV